LIDQFGYFPNTRRFRCRARRQLLPQHFQSEGNPGQFLAKSIVEILADPHLLLRSNLQNFALQTPALGDIAHLSGEHPLASDSKFAHAQVKWKDASILAPPGHFAPDPDDPRVAGAKIIHHVAVMFAGVGLGHEHFYILPDHLFGLVTKQLSRRWIERFDDPAFIDSDDPFQRRIDDGRHTRPSIAQRVFGAIVLNGACQNIGDRSDKHRVVVGEVATILRVNS